jgi:hypothetical protein
MPEEIVVDGNPTYPIAVRALKRDHILAKSTRCRNSHHDNNMIEQDHRGIQRPANGKQYFRSLAAARHALAGYEALRMISKGQVVGCGRGDACAQSLFLSRLLQSTAEAVIRKPVAAEGGAGSQRERRRLALAARFNPGLIPPAFSRFLHRSSALSRKLDSMPEGVFNQGRSGRQAMVETALVPCAPLSA